MYCGGLFVYEYKPLFFPGSAHAVVIRAAMLFVVQFPVTEYKCFRCSQCLHLTAGISPNLFVLYVSQYIYLKSIYFNIDRSNNRP